MSVERSFEPWEEMQRHGHELADRLAQGFSGLIHSHVSAPSFSWPNPQKNRLFDVEFEFPAQHFEFVPKDFGLAMDSSGISGVAALLDMGNMFGQAGADLGACFNELVHHFSRRFPLPFKHEDSDPDTLKLQVDVGGERSGMGLQMRKDLGSLEEQIKERFSINDAALDGVVDEEISTLNLNVGGLFGRSQGTFNFSSTYDNRTKDVENSLVARGDLWRVELSNGSSTAGNESSSLFLVQLGPLLFVRDRTLLLPVHLSKQHLLWYGYDRKNGLHSLCPAVWSKHRRWLMMSMICLNPVACVSRKFYINYGALFSFSLSIVFGKFGKLIIKLQLIHNIGLFHIFCCLHRFEGHVSDCIVDFSAYGVQYVGMSSTSYTLQPISPSMIVGLGYYLVIVSIRKEILKERGKRRKIRTRKR